MPTRVAHNPAKTGRQFAMSSVRMTAATTSRSAVPSAKVGDVETR
jgi:hypothetical protein